LFISRLSSSYAQLTFSQFTVVDRAAFRKQALRIVKDQLVRMMKNFSYSPDVDPATMNQAKSRKLKNKSGC